MLDQPQSSIRRFVVLLGLGASLLLGAATAAQAQAENRLVIGMSAEPTSLDPQWHVGLQRPMMYPLLYDRLVRMDSGGVIVGELAERFEVSDDGMLLTFHLRQGHTFHDGTPVNAEAVQRSYERFFDPEMPFTENAPLMNVGEVVAVDEYTVEFRMTQPDAFILNKLVYETNSIVSPDAALGTADSFLGNLEAFARQPVGSGPFRFSSWERGSRIVLEKNHDHWQAGESNIDVIEFRIIPESTGRAIALELGEIDLADRLSPEDALPFVDHPAVELHTFPLVQVIYLMFHHGREQWQDARVRRAIAHAIDREVLIDVIVQGFGVEINTIVPAGIFPSAPQPPYEYDPERARELLQEAGVTSLNADFWVPTGSIPAARQLGEAIGAMLGDVGINADIQLMEHDTWRLTLRAGPEQANFDISLFGWAHSTGEADRGLTQVFRTANWAPECCNWHYYSNPAVDERLDTARSLLTDQAREPHYLEVQSILWEDVAMYPLFQTTSLDAATRDLTDFQILSGGSWNLRQANLER